MGSFMASCLLWIKNLVQLNGVFYIKETADFSLNYQYFWGCGVDGGRVLVIIVTFSNFSGIS